MGGLGNVGAGIGGAAAGTVLGAVGTAVTAHLSNRAAEKAQEHQKKMYRSRYQWTMEDMRLAGLNPMLAYRQGVGGPGSAPMAQVPDFGQAAVGGMQAGAKTAKVTPETELLRQQTTTSARHANALDAGAHKDKMLAGQAWANTRLTGEQELTELRRRQNIEAATTAQELANIKGATKADMDKTSAGRFRIWADQWLGTARKVIPFTRGD